MNLTPWDPPRILWLIVFLISQTVGTLKEGPECFHDLCLIYFQTESGKLMVFQMYLLIEYHKEMTLGKWSGQKAN